MRWITLQQLYEETGVPVRTIQHIRDTEPGVLTVRTRGSTREYAQPACAVALRHREAQKAIRDRGGEIDEGAERARKMAAEADLKELELAERRRELVPAEEARIFTESLVGGFASVAGGRLQQFEREIVATKDAADARRLTQRMTTELMQGAQDYAETLEQEANDGPTADDLPAAA